MSTHKLIAAALVCGLAILVAGGVFLVNLAANRDELTVPDLLAVGESDDVAGVAATVLGAEAAGDAVVLRVRLAAGDRTVSDAGEGWALVIGDAREPVAVDGDRGPVCAGLEVTAGTAAECVLGFAAADGSGFVEYARDDDRARWRLDG